MLNADAILNWPFEPRPIRYDIADCIRYAKGFGAGLPGVMSESDSRFLSASQTLALPFIAVPLVDDFWEQDPRTGIVWQKILHAGESITVHSPLPAHGELVLKRRVNQLLDRGLERGAVLMQQQGLWQGATELVTVDVTTVLRGNGGFGGAPDNSPRISWVPTDRPADAQINLATPHHDNALFEIDAALAVAAGANGEQRPLRGVCSFGLAGRAALHLLCGNDPARLQHFAVRYAGLIFTGETMCIEMWHLQPGRAALRMSSVERKAAVLSQCLLIYS
jgi:hypothetical protein